MSSSDQATLSAQVNKLSLNDDQRESEDQTSELVAVVDDLLSNLGTKFNNLSSELIAKMDEMTKRLDNLEADIQASKRDGGASASRPPQ